MKLDVPIRIVVERPLPGVKMQVQKGRDELLPPARAASTEAVFEFAVTVDISNGQPNFLGKFAQGPKNARFLYVNSGTLAGQPDSCWTRRAKVSLMSITRNQVEKVLASHGSVLEARLYGMGNDGGPACAGVKLLGNGWAVAEK